jgi:cold shock CspA family protein
MQESFVRYQGQVRYWDEPRGCGIVVRDGSHEALFVQGGEIPLDDLPPRVGEKVSFALGLDARGQRRALRLAYVERRPALNAVNVETAEWFHHPRPVEQVGPTPGVPLPDAHELTVPVPFYGQRQRRSADADLRQLRYPPRRQGRRSWAPLFVIMLGVVGLVWSLQSVLHKARASEHFLDPAPAAIGTAPSRQGPEAVEDNAADEQRSRATPPRRSLGDDGRKTSGAA